MIVPRRVEVGVEETYLSWDRFRGLFYSSSAGTVLWKRLLVAAWAVADMFVVQSVARCWLIAMAVLFCRAGKLVGILRDSWLRGMCVGGAMPALVVAMLVTMVEVEIRDALRDPCLAKRS